MLNGANQNPPDSRPASRASNLLPASHEGRARGTVNWVPLRMCSVSCRCCRLGLRCSLVALCLPMWPIWSEPESEPYE